MRSDLASVALGPADGAQAGQLSRDKQEWAAIQFCQSKTGGSLGEAKDAICARAPLGGPDFNSAARRWAETVSPGALALGVPVGASGIGG